MKSKLTRHLLITFILVCIAFCAGYKSFLDLDDVRKCESIRDELHVKYGKLPFQLTEKTVAGIAAQLQSN